MRSFVSLFSATAVALGATVSYNFNITNAVIARTFKSQFRTLEVPNLILFSADGFNRPGVVVNGAFPGTLIQANKDDVLHINVQNFLTNPTMRRSTTIHWHGLVRP
jgi:iron transport multicopper oxidase